MTYTPIFNDVNVGHARVVQLVTTRIERITERHPELLKADTVKIDTLLYLLPEIDMNVLIGTGRSLKKDIGCIHYLLSLSEGDFFANCSLFAARFGNNVYLCRVKFQNYGNRKTTHTTGDKQTPERTPQSASQKS